MGRRSLKNAMLQEDDQENPTLDGGAQRRMIMLEKCTILSDRIKPIPFHGQLSFQDTSLEYAKHGNQRNWKINFYRPEGHSAFYFRRKTIHFASPESIVNQTR